MALVFSPSVPSTGTNFVRHFFAIPGNVNMRRLDMLLKGTVTLTQPHCLIFTHFMYHLDRMQDIWDFKPGCHMVIPMRDPLASLLTHSGYSSDAQKQAFRVDRRMEEFERALEMQDRRPVVYLPIDLYSTFEDRCNVLTKVGNGLIAEDKIKEWAADWPVHNTRGEYGPKLWYQAGDIDKVKAHLEVDGRWQQLKQSENKVRPYLEQMGYKDLMWYD